MSRHSKGTYFGAKILSLGAVASFRLLLGLVVTQDAATNMEGKS